MHDPERIAFEQLHNCLQILLSRIIGDHDSERSPMVWQRTAGAGVLTTMGLTLANGSQWPERDDSARIMWARSQAIRREKALIPEQ
jgi:hypothetical protein